jgi:hypothetical protein
LFDVFNPHEHPPTHHAAQTVHFSYKKTMNTKSKQQVFQVVTDQEIILHDSPSNMHQFLSPYSFLEPPKSQFNLDNPIFDDYFYVLELNVNINLSFIDTLQSKISKLDSKKLVTENIEYVEHNDFF